MKTASEEDYLKAIYLIQLEQGPEPLSTTQLAGRMNVAGASVTGMLKKMAGAEPPVVDYAPYSGVRLTEQGEKIALEVIRHHRLIESYLNQALGYPWDKVHAEAERLEHFISEELEERMAAALGHPRTDPHGEPIPDRNGAYTLPVDIPLTDLEVGQWATVRRVSPHDPELLRYLDDLGLRLQARVEVTSKGPFNGPLHVRIFNGEDKVHAISREVSDYVFVELE